MFHLAHIREQMAGEPVHVQWCVWWERGPWWDSQLQVWVQTAASTSPPTPPWLERNEAVGLI